MDFSASSSATSPRRRRRNHQIVELLRVRRITEREAPGLLFTEELFASGVRGRGFRNLAVSRPALPDVAAGGTGTLPHPRSRGRARRPAASAPARKDRAVEINQWWGPRECAWTFVNVHAIELTGRGDDVASMGWGAEI